MIQAQERWAPPSFQMESEQVGTRISTEPAKIVGPRVVSRQKFSAEEDELLLSLVKKYGTQNWKCVMLGMQGRTARQCRERFKYYLEPTLNKDTWTEAEDRILMAKFHEVGPKWARIASFLQNRTPIDLKNRFHLLQRSVKKGLVKPIEREVVRSEPEVRPPRLPPIETLLEIATPRVVTL